MTDEEFKGTFASAGGVGTDKENNGIGVGGQESSFTK